MSTTLRDPLIPKLVVLLFNRHGPHGHQGGSFEFLVYFIFEKVATVDESPDVID